MCGVACIQYIQRRNYPVRKAMIDEELNLKQLADKDVYLVDNYYVDLKINYLREHYYPEARAELQKEIDGYQIWKIYTE